MGCMGTKEEKHDVVMSKNHLYDFLFFYYLFLDLFFFIVFLNSQQFIAFSSFHVFFVCSSFQLWKPLFSFKDGIEGTELEWRSAKDVRGISSRVWSTPGNMIKLRWVWYIIIFRMIKNFCVYVCFVLCEFIIIEEGTCISHTPSL